MATPGTGGNGHTPRAMRAGAMRIGPLRAARRSA